MDSFEIIVLGGFSLCGGTVVLIAVIGGGLSAIGGIRAARAIRSERKGTSFITECPNGHSVAAAWSAAGEQVVCPQCRAQYRLPGKCVDRVKQAAFVALVFFGIGSALLMFGVINLLNASDEDSRIAERAAKHNGETCWCGRQAIGKWIARRGNETVGSPVSRCGRHVNVDNPQAFRWALGAWLTIFGCLFGLGGFAGLVAFPYMMYTSVLPKGDEQDNVPATR